MDKVKVLLIPEQACKICQGKFGIRTAPQNALCGVASARSMLTSFIVYTYLYFRVLVVVCVQVSA